MSVLLIFIGDLSFFCQYIFHNVLQKIQLVISNYLEMVLSKIFTGTFVLVKIFVGYSLKR